MVISSSGRIPPSYQQEWWPRNSTCLRDMRPPPCEGDNVTRYRTSHSCSLEIDDWHWRATKAAALPHLGIRGWRCRPNAAAQCSRPVQPPSAQGRLVHLLAFTVPITNPVIDIVDLPFKTRSIMSGTQIIRHGQHLFGFVAIVPQTIQHLYFQDVFHSRSPLLERGLPHLSTIAQQRVRQTDYLIRWTSS